MQNPFLLSLVSLGLLLSPALQAAPFSLVYEAAIWPKKEIVVCFGDASHFNDTWLGEEKMDDLSAKDVQPVSDAHRKLIQAAITREYTDARTGIFFSGWKSCSSSASEADVVLFVSGSGFTNVLWGRSSIGRNMDVKRNRTSQELENKTIHPEMKAALFLRRPESRGDYLTSELESFEITAIHEFGHLAGLGHEQFRIYQGQEDVNCQMTDLQYPNRREEKQPRYGNNVRLTGAYDPNSIMNYCWSDALDQISGLEFTVDSSLPKFQPKDLPEDDGFHFPIEPSHAYKTSNGILPPGSLLLADPTLYTVTKLSATQTHYRVKIGLSQGDVHALRCFYADDCL